MDILFEEPLVQFELDMYWVQVCVPDVPLCPFIVVGAGLAPPWVSRGHTQGVALPRSAGSADGLVAACSYQAHRDYVDAAGWRIP